MECIWLGLRYVGRLNRNRDMIDIYYFQQSRYND